MVLLWRLLVMPKEMKNKHKLACRKFCINIRFELITRNQVLFIMSRKVLCFYMLGEKLYEMIYASIVIVLQCMLVLSCTFNNNYYAYMLSKNTKEQSHKFWDKPTSFQTDVGNILLYHCWIFSKSSHRRLLLLDISAIVEDYSY